MKNLTSGSLKVGTVGGAQILVHWTVPVGGLIFWAIFSRNLQELAFYCVAYIILVGIHELGHLSIARLGGLRVDFLYISGEGGSCHLQRTPNPMQMFWVALGGPAAQMLLLVGTLGYLEVFGFPSSGFGNVLVKTFIAANLFVLVINVIPVQMSDGRETDGSIILALVRHLHFGGPNPFPQPAEVSPLLDSGISLVKQGIVFPRGFKFGLEVLNDNSTPMLFVVEILKNMVGLTDREAIALMVRVHNEGGTIIGCRSEEEAERLASEIAEASKKAGHAFVCRAIRLDSAS